MDGTMTVEWVAAHPSEALMCVALLLVTLAAIRSRPLASSRGVKMLLLTAALATSAQAGVFDLSAGLLGYVGGRWGGAGAGRVAEWKARMATETNAGHTDLEHLASTNAYWNRVRYAEDPRHWRAADYWATPVEMLGSNGGDCEDYVFGKYFTLRAIGIPVSQLRVIYVRASGLAQGHMVLAYYATPDADPLILDNLTDDILPASQRTDLQPVYSFNDDDLWAGPSTVRSGRANQVRAWGELLEKIGRERAL